ncbi:MAG: hypothetical protein U0359_36115 [Byssovorax sp.]
MSFRIFRGNAADWEDLPHQLGMSVNEAGLLVGRWNGHIEIRGLHTYELVRPTNHQKDEYYRYYTELYALLDPPLHMGLHVYERGGFGKVLGDLFGSKDIQVGHAEFDDRFDVRGLDADHVRRLLYGPVGTELLAQQKRHPKLWISDIYATVEYPEYERDLDKVRAGLETAGRLGEVILAQRAQQLAAWEPMLRRTWQAVASGWRLDFDAPRVTIKGEARGLRLEASVVLLGGDKLATEVRFPLPLPAACGLTLARQHGGDNFLFRFFRGQDIKIGHPDFDAAFVVKGEPEAQVRALLNPAACQALLALQARTTVLALDKGVLRCCVPDVLVSPDHLDDLLKAGFLAAEALSPGITRGGPYR